VPRGVARSQPVFDVPLVRADELPSRNYIVGFVAGEGLDDCAF
jgi:hypothetical protein